MLGGVHRDGTCPQGGWRVDGYERGGGDRRARSEAFAYSYPGAASRTGRGVLRGEPGSWGPVRVLLPAYS